MAPKRARHAGSSSARPISSDESSMGVSELNKFVSPEAHAEFTRLLSKPVEKEKGFLPTSKDGELIEMIRDKGWETICEAPEAVPLSIVHEFYVNSKITMDGYSVVRGLIVDYTAAAIHRVIGKKAKPRGVDDWTLRSRANVDLDYILSEISVPGTRWKKKAFTDEKLTFPASTMNMYARAWNLLICANIFPSSHSHEVTVERAILLWAILNKEYIDLGYVIHQSMLRFMRGGTTGAIPHASIMVKLCSAVGVRWKDDEQQQMPSAPTDHSIIARMTEWQGGVPHGKGIDYIFDDV